jgi:hypothetical protein
MSCRSELCGAVDRVVAVGQPDALGFRGRFLAQYDDMMTMDLNLDTHLHHHRQPYQVRTGD